MKYSVARSGVTRAPTNPSAPAGAALLSDCRLPRYAAALATKPEPICMRSRSSPITSRMIRLPVPLDRSSQDPATRPGEAWYRVHPKLNRIHSMPSQLWISRARPFLLRHHLDHHSQTMGSLSIKMVCSAGRMFRVTPHLPANGTSKTRCGGMRFMSRW